MKTRLSLFAGLIALGISIIVGTSTWAQEDHDRRVLIVNNTSYTMTGFYASNVDRDEWEEDILGQSILEPGHEVVVNLDDGTDHCMYDLKAVFDGDNESVYRYGFDVCRNVRWTIHE